MPHDDKHYQKLQRTFKFVFDALCLVAVVLIVGLLLIWLYDKIGGTFLPRPWKIVLSTNKGGGLPTETFQP